MKNGVVVDESDDDEPPEEPPCFANRVRWKRHASALLLREARRRAVAVAAVERAVAGPLRMTLATLRALVSPASAAFSARALVAICAVLRDGGDGLPVGGASCTELNAAIARLGAAIETI